jgi:enoyl-CoA hydratase
MGRFYRMYLSVRDLAVPTIAALNGPAIGAGLCVALACDLRIAAREAKLGLNFTKLGIHPGMAATWTLPRIIGSAHAAELIYTGRVIDGEEAARIGLANRAVAREETVPAALALAEEIASAAPVAVRGAKRSLAKSAGADLGTQLDQEAGEQAICYESADLLEGLAAVREKRAPKFSGS